MDEQYGTFESVEERLQAIADAVSADDLPLDEALALYEEAVSLGMRACDLSEEGIRATCPEPASDEGELPEAAEGAASAEEASSEEQPPACADGAPAPDDAAAR